MVTTLIAALGLVAAPPTGTYATHGDERLAALVEEALLNNPKILQSFAEHQADRHRIGAATALPDPTVSVTQFARSIETRAGPQRRVLALSQAIPGRGKRAANAQLSAKAASISSEIHHAVRAEVTHGVKHAYYELGYVDRALAISRGEQALLEHFEEISRRRYAQGFGLQGDVLRLQAQITRTVQDRQRLAEQRVSHESRLNALRGAPPDEPVPRVQLGSLPALALDPESLAEIAERARPEIRAAMLRIEKGEKEVHIARIRHRPDLTVGLAWGNVRARDSALAGIALQDNGKDSYSVTLGLSLPLFWNKYDSGIREASERAAAARLGYRHAVTESAAQIRATTFRLGSIRKQIDLFESTLVAQAEQALHVTQAAYSNGAAEVTALLDIQRTLLDVQLGLARLRADWLRAAADLERSLGSAVPAGVTP